MMKIQYEILYELIDKNEFTPLYIAAKRDQAHIAEYLIEMGADLEAPSLSTVQICIMLTSLETNATNDSVQRRITKDDGDTLKRRSRHKCKGFGMTSLFVNVLDRTYRS